MDCMWYITCPPGEQIDLIIFGMETASESISVYDSPSPYFYSSSDRELVMSGKLDTAMHFTSSFFAIFYVDRDHGPNEPGIVFETHIHGMAGKNPKS